MIKWSSNTYSVWGVTLQSVKLRHSSGKLYRRRRSTSKSWGTLLNVLLTVRRIVVQPANSILARICVLGEGGGALHRAKCREMYPQRGRRTHIEAMCQVRSCHPEVMPTSWSEHRLARGASVEHDDIEVSIQTRVVELRMCPCRV